MAWDTLQRRAILVVIQAIINAAVTDKDYPLECWYPALRSQKDRCHSTMLYIELRQKCSIKALNKCHVLCLLSQLLSQLLLLLCSFVQDTILHAEAITSCLGTLRECLPMRTC